MRFKSKGLKKVVGANVVIIALLFLKLSAYAGSVPNVFTSGTVAKSSEVNANFTYLGERCWDKSGSNLYYMGKGNYTLGSTDPYWYTQPYILRVHVEEDTEGVYVDSVNKNSSKHGLEIYTEGLGAQMAFLVGSRVQGIGDYKPSFAVLTNGNVGIGTYTPSYPLHFSSGAYVTTGGVWTNASSREYKKDIQSLTSEDAMLAFNKLEPVSFKYKTNDEQHIGFIAEDVPDLVASKDRKGLSTMDVVALLTKVVQEQQKIAQEQQKTIAELKEEVRALKAKTQ